MIVGEIHLKFSSNSWLHTFHGEKSNKHLQHPQKIILILHAHPLLNVYKTMEERHVWWVNPLFLCPCSIAMLVYQRVNHDEFLSLSQNCSPHSDKTSPTNKRTFRQKPSVFFHSRGCDILRSVLNLVISEYQNST